MLCLLNFVDLLTNSLIFLVIAMVQILSCALQPGYPHSSVWTSQLSCMLCFSTWHWIYHSATHEVCVCVQVPWLGGFAGVCEQRVEQWHHGQATTANPEGSGANSLHHSIRWVKDPGCVTTITFFTLPHLSFISISPPHHPAPSSYPTSLPSKFMVWWI